MVIFTGRSTGLLPHDRRERIVRTTTRIAAGSVFCRSGYEGHVFVTRVVCRSMAAEEMYMASRRKKPQAAARRVKLESLEGRILFAVEIAENLLVNVDATTLPAGDAQDVPNTGTLGGVFEATGGGDTVPVIGRPRADATAGTQGIRLDGTDYLQLLDAVGGSLIAAPDGIVGTDPTASIETWVWNGSIAGEETQVSWGHRNGPDGTNMSFNYGNDSRWGAVGHWGNPDAGWGPPDGAQQTPSAKHWHHLVYTYDGTTTHLYVDGAPVYSEELGSGVLNTYSGTAINIGTQLEADGQTPTGGLRGSLTLGRVRIHDGVLTDAQVLANYNAEKADFVDPTLPPPTPPPAEILVNIDATKLPEGPANDIPNTAPLGGVFEATGGEGTVPVIAPPLTSVSTGTRGIRLDGTDFLQLVNEPNGSLITAPADITGVDPESSIETWVWNPGVAPEETMVSWGKRGGPDGTNMSFNYGSSPDFGAVGHWGSPDLGWGPTVPAAQQWHHLVYTFDGQVQRVYMDGQLANSEDLGPGILNTYADTPFNIGAQLEGDGSTVTGGLRGSLTLGRVRIYKGTLTDAQILANYNNEKGDFVNPTVDAAALTAPPIHRYSFSETSGDASNVAVVDSIGDADGVVLGEGATFNGSQLVLPGGPSATAAYVDLPNGLLSSLSADNGGSGKVTFEGWVRHTGNQSWSRFYDFGATTVGELTGPGGDGLGSDYWFLAAQTGGDVNTHRIGLDDFDDGDPTGNGFVDVSGSFNQLLHFAATWDESTGELKLYQQGTEVAAFNSSILISAINDVNNWLGRSNYTPDSNLQADYDEFRIYNRVLTAGEVRGDFQAGPDVLTSGGVPSTVKDTYVRASGWNATFLNYLATQSGQNSAAGFRVSGFGADSTTLSFTGLDTIAVKFTGNVPASLQANQVAITSAAGRSYTVQSISTDQADPTLALIKLSTPILNDRVRITLQGIQSQGGGAAEVRLNVLPGDVNQSGGAVNASDVVLTRNRVGRSTASPGTGSTAYNVFNDVNGDGIINASDLVLVRNRIGVALPGNPAPVFSAQRIAPPHAGSSDRHDDLVALLA